MGVQGKLDPKKDFLKASLRKIQIGYLGQGEGQRSEAQRLLPLFSLESLGPFVKSQHPPPQQFIPS